MTEEPPKQSDSLYLKTSDLASLAPLVERVEKLEKEMKKLLDEKKV